MSKIFIIAGLAILFRVFVFDIYKIPSESMKESLLPGDYVLANKIVYGLRKPRGPIEIPIFNLLATVPALRNWFFDTKWTYSKWPSDSKISRNDIVIFESTQSEDILIKRCIGLPGDTIQIIGNRLKIDSHLIEEAENIKYVYEVDVPIDSMNLIIDPAKRVYINSQVLESEMPTKYLLNKDELDLVAKYFGSDRIALFSRGMGQVDWGFSPLIIPKMGQRILLKRNGTIAENYIEVINKYEPEVVVEVDGDKILINDIQGSSYVFKQNYYFMLGDNRSFSTDSRSWGVLPESSIIGRVKRVIFSINPTDKSIERNRVLKRIN